MKKRESNKLSLFGNNLSGGGGDLLDGAHEDVGYDGHSHEAVEEAEQVEESAHLHRPRELVDERQEQRFRTGVVVQRPIVRGHPFRMIRLGTDSSRRWPCTDQSALLVAKSPRQYIYSHTLTIRSPDRFVTKLRTRFIIYSCSARVANR